MKAKRGMHGSRLPPRNNLKPIGSRRRIVLLRAGSQAKSSRHLGHNLVLAHQPSHPMAPIAICSLIERCMHPRRSVGLSAFKVNLSDALKQNGIGLIRALGRLRRRLSRAILGCSHFRKHYRRSSLSPYSERGQQMKKENILILSMHGKCRAQSMAEAYFRNLSERGLIS